MKETKKVYWKGLEQLTNNVEFVKNADKEFPEYLPINENEEEGPNRRDFLKMMGFGIAAVSLAACEAPVRKAIPYVKKPVDVDPSVPNYYASTYFVGNDYNAVVVKTREGRPIKVEGNKLSEVTGGGSTAQSEASVLSLYDKQRYTDPQIGGKKATWEEVDAQVVAGLGSANKVTIVSYSNFSPSTLRAIEALKSRYSNVEHVMYDPKSSHGALEANLASFGVRALPTYDYSKAKTIVSFNADFLGSSPTQTLNNKQFAQSRKLGDNKKDMSRLYVFESNFSLTGANADYRTPIKPSQEAKAINALYNLVAKGLGQPTLSVHKNSDVPANLEKAAKDLIASKGNSIVVSGSNDVNVQILVNGINSLLGSYGKTIDMDKVSNLRKGDDKKMSKFVADLKAGAAGAVIFFNCNPVYDHPKGGDIASALGKAAVSVATSDRLDETSKACKIVAPDHHYLESWNDFQPVKGHYSLSQPTIKNIFNTRQAQVSFLTWAGVENTDYYTFIQDTWKANGIGEGNFQTFFDKCLLEGVYKNFTATSQPAFNADINAASVAATVNGKVSGIELLVYENGGVGAGFQANNPWLQEMPDPITKACWDNYITVSAKHADELGLVLGDMTTQLAEVSVNGQTFKLPVMVQPGQADGTVGIALGYGRTVAGKVAEGVGVSAYPLLTVKDGVTSLASSGVSITLTGEAYKVAQTQTAQTYAGRDFVVQESILKNYQKDPSAGRHTLPITDASGNKNHPYAITLWSGHEYNNHHWGMAIDLNSCTGCGACTVACQVENNVPVVGKQEVLNRREMSWLRIDRYYSYPADEITDETGVLDEIKIKERVAENPEVVFQPMMCQQCNNAPCETVCPVAATTHSSEGLNQMTYNRCIGTRYCANNCPYKVRRFNWFKYHDNKQFDKNLSMNNDLGKMVLNPDVTVRARGVMEKCTFCVQRIQAGKLEARKDGRRPEDGEINTACASSCPSEALVFGDMKDPNSRISQLLKIERKDKMATAKEPRAFHALEELRVMPNVWYLTKIRNKDEETNKEAHA